LNQMTIGRLLSSGLALSLALIYSGLLGVEKRSVLSFVLVTSLLITLIVVSSFSTRYKKIALGSPITDSIHGAYLIWCSILSLLVGVIVLLVSLLYSSVIANLAPNLLLVIFIYSIVSTFSFSLQDFLPALGRFKTAILSDLSLVIFQLVSFVFIFSIDQLSIIVTVLLSLIFSYVIHIFSIASIILFHRKPLNILSDLRRLTRVKRLFFVSSTIHIVDRIDKVFIAFLLPLATLAQFTTMAAFFAPVKIITESATRQLYFSKTTSETEQKVRTHSAFNSLLLLVAFTLITPYILAKLVNFFIASLLGNEWLLPTYLVALYFINEVIRGLYLYLTNYRITENKYQYSRKAPISLLILSIVLVPISVLHFGLIGALIAMITSYGLVLTGLKFAHAF